MVVTIIGHGYVGLVTAAVFADLGNTVYCVGRTLEKIEKLKKGIAPFFEPGLTEVVKRNIEANRLHFTLSYEDAVPGADVVFICVGTPSKDNGEADLTQVFNAAASIAKNLSKYTVIACKSTVPVGTNFKIKEHIKKILVENSKNNIEFNMASCPEFLREGTALSDTLHPDRIVIGIENKKTESLLLELHRPINGERVLTNIPTAEMIKYAANSFLATKISFANAIAFLCDKIGADVVQVLDGVGLDKRIGRAFLYPGVGFGGSCFPKDVKALIAQAHSLGYNFSLLRSVQEINHQAVTFFVEKVERNIKPSFQTVLAILGLAFKPDTDDMRDAPSVPLIKALLKKGYKIRAYDPQAVDNAKTVLKNIEYAKNPYEAAKDASGLLIITEWNEFKQLNLTKIKNLMKKPIIIDGRNIYQSDEVKNAGFTYFGVGRS